MVRLDPDTFRDASLQYHHKDTELWAVRLLQMDTISLVAALNVPCIYEDGTFKAVQNPGGNRGRGSGYLLARAP